MKKIFTLFSFSIMLGVIDTSAQPWMQSVSSPNPTFTDIQRAFNEYWSTRPIEKGKGYKPFKRWEWYWEQRVDSNGHFPSPSVTLNEWNNYRNSHPQNGNRSASGNWIFMGPSTTPGGYNGLGRVNCIAFHPSIANTFWIGTPAGGLWKTTDGGDTWSTNTDDLPVLGVSDIAIDPTNPNIMYIATGDGEAAGSVTALGATAYGDTKSIGILKSTNGGSTWSMTGMNWNVTSAKLIRRLLINPNNPQILIAAASDGIWRTTNGGASWSNVQSGYFMDVEFKSTDPSIVYASTYSWGNAQIYRSTNSGFSWASVVTLPSVMRINLAVTTDEPDLVDALCTNTQGGLEGLWYSANSGASFSLYYNLTNMLNCADDASGTGGQGGYDLAYLLNPLDADEIWLGGINTWKGTNAGSTWTLSNYPHPSAINGCGSNPGVPTVHADKHFLAFHPLNNAYLYECNDGGIYVTDNSGANWYDLSDGLEISQLYRIGVSQTVNNNIICGLQDNGSREFYNNQWYEQTGGDGMECIIDYTNANVEYASYAGGVIYRTTNFWQPGFTTTISNNIPGQPTGAWVTPFVMHPTNPQILFAGYKQLFKTTNQGNSWSAISPLLTSNYLRSIAVAPSNTNYIYAASFDTLYVTYDGGSNWYFSPPVGGKITYITVHPTNPQILWITCSGYTSGQKVFKSINGGASWTNVSGTLPNLPVNCIVYHNGTNDGLYIGTDAGVFYRDASMSDWIHYSDNLPNVVVTELEISYNNNKLWAATFGRGLWQSDLYTNCNPVTPSISISSTATSICTGQSVSFTATPTNGGTSPSYQWKINGGNVGSNSPAFSSSTLANGNIVTCVLTSNVYCATTSTATSNSIPISVNSPVTPSVNISPNTTQTICSGQTVSFTASPTNGGSNPTYQWYIDGNLMGSGSAFTTGSLTNNSTVYCRMTSNANCANPNPVNSSTTSIVISGAVTPSVTISPSTTQTICSGQIVSFTASPTNGGSSPTYQWYLNGSPVGSGSTYTTTSLSNNASVYCQMTSNANCVSPTTANSPTTSIAVSSSVIPSVSISATTATTICSGQTVSFIASPTNGGSNPTYQWYVNSNPVVNGATFTTSPLTANSTVYCLMTSNSTCANPATANSNSVSVTVNQNPIAFAGTDVTIMQGDSTTLSATGGVSYSWNNGGGIDQSIRVSPIATTLYTVTVTDGNGCTATDNVNVSVQPACNNIYTLSSSTATVPASGGNCSTNISTDAACSWNVNPGGCIGWVTPINLSGTGTANISFTVQPNTLTSQRTCFVTIKDSLFSIIQAAAITDIQELLAIKNISLFPNPNNGEFTLSIESAITQKVNANVFNSLGQIILKEEIETNTQTEFNLSGNAKGVYYLQLNADGRHYYKKVVIE